MKQRLVFISNMPAPYQVKFCYELQKFFDTEFWFHVHLSDQRPDWWIMDLGEKCKILKAVLFKKKAKYLSLKIISELNRFKPDIVILGNWFFPSCLVAYYWARLCKRKVIIFTEILRKNGKLRVPGDLRVSLVKFMYRDVDAIFTHSDDATRQLKDAFGFGDNVFTAQYPADIDTQLTHELRNGKQAYTYLFANRLTDIYNPLLSIEIFVHIANEYPGSKMLMNGSGELRKACEAKIAQLYLSECIEFLDNITSWNELHKVYRDSDVLILPAVFSAGNFTILEAMASGMGIIISNKIFGSGKFIEHGKNGFVCEPNVEDFVKYTTKYIEHPELLKIHGKINKKKVEKHSIAATAKLYNEFIHKYVFKEHKTI